MSVETSTNVWTHSRTQGVRLLALLALADIADDNGLCWPSVDYLSEKLRQADRYTRMVLKELKLAGELYVIPRTEWNSKVRWKSNAYIIMAGMTEERFVRACRHDPLNYPEEQARELFRAISPDSIPTETVFQRRRGQGHDEGVLVEGVHEEGVLEASDLKQPRYERIEVNPPNSAAANPDHMIRGNNLEGQNYPDDMIRVNPPDQPASPDHMIRGTDPGDAVYPDDMIRGTAASEGINPDHMIPRTLIIRSPNTSKDTKGGPAGSLSSSLPVFENAPASQALTDADFRDLKVMLRATLERGVYNDLIVPAGLSGETGPGLLILDVPTQSHADRINHMLARTIEAQLTYMLGAAGTRVLARASPSAGAGPSAGVGLQQSGAKEPAAARASPAVGPARPDAHAEDAPY